MPIISKIGRRSIKVRIVYIVMFFVLIVGAASMLYPLLLMVSGSLKSQADYMNITPWPKYLFNELPLFQKYIESKYNDDLPRVEASFRETIPAYNRITKPAACDEQLLENYMEWRSESSWWFLGHASGSANILPENSRGFRKMFYKRFAGDLDAFNTESNLLRKSWSDVLTPKQDLFRYPRPRTGGMAMLLEFAEDRPVRNRIIPNLDGRFWKKYLVPEYTNDVKVYNKRHGTNYASYDEVFLTRSAPVNELQRKDWEEFVRKVMSFQFVKLLPSVEDEYQAFLADDEKYAGDIEQYNARFKTNYASFDEIPLPARLPANRMKQIDWGEFVKNPEACPLEGIEIYGPRQAFENFVAKKRGISVTEITPLPMPIIQADWHDCMANKRHYRWEFATRNYKQVFGYIMLHGRGVQNTIIFCALAVGLALVVNPIAAYALSRYKPPSQYKILLICMATMAFPSAVTMIPGFILLKRFPLWSLLGGGVGFGITIWLLSRYFKNMSETVRLVISIIAGIAVGGWLVPTVTMGKPYVSLLNTFAALVLPGMANGYSIFLLKGFFDSLPREIYEAADIDGASEWTKFWALTMNLSKPILAVIALGAFTAAYSQFMMALIIIPDEKMWTLMVWLFQLQSYAHQSVVYASLVIGAVPTFLIFVFCQGIIMRGIVVPTEK